MYESSQACIRLSDGLTNQFKIGMGVRQGDVLSPNLFNIFINDLPKYFQSCADSVKLNTADLHCLMYADDVVILTESATGLQEKLNKLEEFCADWCLNVNTDKTKIIFFNKAGSNIKWKFIFHDIIIDCVSSYRYLGLYF